MRGKSPSLHDYGIDKRDGFCAYGVMAAIAIQNLIGKTVLIGVSKLDHHEELLEQKQYVGVITSMDSLIHIRLKSGEDFTLPPDLSAFQEAQRGIYRLRSTGEEVENPDFLVSWTVHVPATRKS